MCLLLMNSLLLSNGAVAYEYSVRSAFCRDYASKKTNIYSSTFQFDLQVAFDSCMCNASNLIKNHEAEKQRQHQRQIESERIRQADIEARIRENKRRKKAYEKKMETIIDKAEDLFR